MYLQTLINVNVWYGMVHSIIPVLARKEQQEKKEHGKQESYRVDKNGTWTKMELGQKWNLAAPPWPFGEWPRL
jgi:predicted transcriptional regulator